MTSRLLALQQFSAGNRQPYGEDRSYLHYGTQGTRRDRACLGVHLSFRVLALCLNLPRTQRRSMKSFLRQSPVRRVELIQKRWLLPKRRIPIYNSTVSQAQRRFAHNPADDPLFRSIVDNPPNLVSTGRRHGPGLIVLGSPSYRF